MIGRDLREHFSKTIDALKLFLHAAPSTAFLGHQLMRVTTWETDMTHSIYLVSYFEDEVRWYAPEAKKTALSDARPPKVVPHTPCAYACPRPQSWSFGAAACAPAKPACMPPARGAAWREQYLTPAALFAVPSLRICSRWCCWRRRTQVFTASHHNAHKQALARH